MMNTQLSVALPPRGTVAMSPKAVEEMATVLPTAGTGLRVESLIEAEGGKLGDVHHVHFASG